MIYHIHLIHRKIKQVLINYNDFLCKYALINLLDNQTNTYPAQAYPIWLKKEIFYEDYHYWQCEIERNDTEYHLENVHKDSQPGGGRCR